MQKLIKDQQAQTAYCYGLAVSAHTGQYRKFVKEDGTRDPYIRHIDDVVKNLFEFEEEIFALLDKVYGVGYKGLLLRFENMIQSAMLHDVIEDTHFTRDSLEEALDRAGVDSNVLKNVCTLTNYFQKDEVMSRNKKLEHYMAIVADGPIEARLLKLMDILANVRDADGGSAEWKERFIREKKYMVSVLMDSFAESKEIASIENAIAQAFDNIKKD